MVVRDAWQQIALTELGVAEFVVLRLSLAAIALWLIVLAMRANAGLRLLVGARWSWDCWSRASSPSWSRSG